MPEGTQHQSPAPGCDQIDAPASLPEAPVAPPPAVENAGEERVGQRLSAWRITARIGSGGMGHVFAAERADGAFTATVAVKVLMRGLASDIVLHRFHLEQQALARLNHPHIARLLDAGLTPDGLPYFVMELVDGVPIDVFCAPLSLERRLGVFLELADAVTYAHRNLLLHRDLKPSNVLVTREGSVKLLDFGIAKVLEANADESQTQRGQGPYTPLYASPEQIRGEPVGTSADVYSLGVLLYELLTGQRPYGRAATTAYSTVQAALTEEPAQPSALAGKPANKKLRGDLDKILLMALRKDPARRYQSVDQLSGDLRRHLEGRPVTARPDTFRYRAGKFVQRNRMASIAFLLVTLAIAAGMTATLHQTRVAERQRALAERRFNEVRRLAHSVVFEYHDAIENLPGSTRVREMLVKDALAYLDRLSQDAGGDRSVERELAEAYVKVGDVQGRAHTANLGDTAGALLSYQKATALLQSLQQSDPGDAAARESLRDALQKIGTLYARRTQQWLQGRDYSLRAIAVGEALVAKDPSNPKYQRDLARVYVYAGDAMLFFGGYAEEVRLDRKALKILEALAEKDLTNELRRHLALCLQRLGTTLEYWGESLQEQHKDTSEIDAKYREAIASHLKVLELVESLLKDEPQNAAFVRYLGSANMNVGGALSRAGDGKAGLPYLQKAFAIMTAIAARDRANLEARLDVAEAEEYLGIGHEAAGDPSAALQHYRQCLTLLESGTHADRMNVELQRQAIRVRKAVGDLSLKTGDLPAALRSYAEALRLAEGLHSDASPDLRLFALGEAHAQLGRYHAALASAQPAPRARKASWQEARTHFQASLSVYRDAQERKLLNAALAYKPELIARELSRCEAALLEADAP